MFRLKIENFQSIGSIEIDFRDFTTLIGKSNRGKSAILRALRTILCNDWQAGFLKEGEKECILTFEIMEKTPYLKSILPDFNIQKIVLRKPINEYVVYLEDGSKLTYPKIGKGVPEVFGKIALSEIVTEREDSFNLNFQAQLDPLFLVTQTDVELSSFINKVFDISRFEKALREMASDDIKFSREITDLENRLPTFNIEISNIETRLGEIEDQIAYLQDLIKRTESSAADFKETYSDFVMYGQIKVEQGECLEKKNSLLGLQIHKDVFQKFSGNYKELREIKDSQKQVTLLKDSIVGTQNYLPPAQNIQVCIRDIQRNLSDLHSISAFRKEKDCLLQHMGLKESLTPSKEVLFKHSELLQKLHTLKQDSCEFNREKEKSENLKPFLNILSLLGESISSEKKIIMSCIEICPVCQQSMCKKKRGKKNEI